MKLSESYKKRLLELADIIPTILLKNLWVNDENMLDAFDEVGENPSSYSSHLPIKVIKNKNNQLFVVDGHHRIADEINKYDDIESILNISFKVNILEDNDFNYTTGEWIPIYNWLEQNGF